MSEKSFFRCYHPQFKMFPLCPNFQNLTLTFNANIPEICIKSTSAEKNSFFVVVVVLCELGRERREEYWEACCSGN